MTQPQFTPEELASEEWRPVLNYEGWYDISNIGRVRRARAGKGTYIGHILQYKYDRAGYAYVVLSCDSRQRRASIHRLVALAFLPNSDAMVLEVNHKDSDRGNARLQNLEWMTRTENNRYTVTAGNWGPPRCWGEGMGRGSKLTEAQVREIVALRGRVTQKELTLRYGVSRAQISRIHNGVRWARAQENVVHNTTIGRPKKTS